MKNNIRRIISGAKTKDWKKIEVEFGDDFLDISVPPDCVVLEMPKTRSPADSKESVARALSNPVGSPTLEEIIRSKGKPAKEIEVCVSLSDITRPVPYKGENGILIPLLEILENAGIKKDNIIFVIGNGMHRPSSEQERIYMYGEEIVENYRIVDHDCEDRSSQIFVAHTSKGSDVYVNEIFYKADLKIVTGLVESHFMAGASGGRKGVCPALVNTRTIQRLHGPEFLEDPKATNLVLEGNPCHDEALEVARTVGVDFLVNATLDDKLRITGVFAGDLEKAHYAAVEVMRKSVEIPVSEPFDIILTHGGFVGRDHYQSVKAAVNAAPAVRKNGFIILVANNRDMEPIGSREYRTLLHLFKMLGPDRYVSILKHPDWIFTKDQWEAEMWGRPIRKIGEEGLVYCAPQIAAEDYEILPGISGYDFIDAENEFDSHQAKTAEMFQNAIIHTVNHPKFKGEKPTIAFIQEGPYAIPVIV